MDSQHHDLWKPTPPRNSIAVMIVPGTMLFAVAFVLGIVVDRAGLLPGSSGLQPAGLASTFAPFWETWRLVDEHYVDRQAVQHDRMTRGAIEGMLDSLGDRDHTTYMTREEFERMESGLKGEMEGIGARITLHDHQPTVASIVPDSPAQKAGLRAGDRFLDVDGTDVSAMSLDRLVTLVRGPAGKPVHVRIERDGKTLALDLTRARVEVPSVTWHLLPGTTVAHVAIEEFGMNTATELQDALDNARKAGARRILLDLRDNPGGLKDQAVDVTSMFLAEGNVFLSQDAQGKQTAVPVKPGGKWTNIPLVVLINQGTASSSEILAGAIQDYGRGKLVGTRTFGTGTVLLRFRLSDGSAVLLAVNEWLTPKGRRIWHEGIEPDKTVTLPDLTKRLAPEQEDGLDGAALAKSGDQQLLEGLQLLEKQLP